VTSLPTSNSSAWIEGELAGLDGGVEKACRIYEREFPNYSRLTPDIRNNPILRAVVAAALRSRENVTMESQAMSLPSDDAREVSSISLKEFLVDAVRHRDLSAGQAIAASVVLRMLTGAALINALKPNALNILRTKIEEEQRNRSRYYRLIHRVVSIVYPLRLLLIPAMIALPTILGRAPWTLTLSAAAWHGFSLVDYIRFVLLSPFFVAFFPGLLYFFAFFKFVGRWLATTSYDSSATYSLYLLQPTKPLTLRFMSDAFISLIIGIGWVMIADNTYRFVASFLKDVPLANEWGMNLLTFVPASISLVVGISAGVLACALHGSFESSIHARVVKMSNTWMEELRSESMWKLTAQPSTAIPKK